MKAPAGHIGPVRGAIILVTAATAMLLVVVVVLELVFGSWLRNNPWDRALALNIVVDRKITFDASGLYPGGGEVPYTRDRWGLRGAYGAPAEIGILTVGGSTTDQRYIPDGATWQDVLERNLRGAGVDLRVANAGVDGHSTFAHLAAYEHWLPLIPGLKPRYVVLFVGLNDLFLASPRKPFEGNADGGSTLKSRVKANSALFRLYGMLRGLLAARKVGADHQPVDFRTVRWVDTPRLAESDRSGRDYAEAFGERFTRLLGQVRASGAVPLCVTQPSMYYKTAVDGSVVGIAADVILPFTEHAPINGVDFRKLRKLQDAVMATACASARAPVIDMESAAWEEPDFYDYVHMTPRGAKKLGERLAAAILKLR